MPPIDCNVDLDLSAVNGKAAIVTGGANGIGEAYVRALVSAGAHVVIADFNPTAGRKLEEELTNTKFVQANVVNWDDQVKLFKEAATFSPSGKIHYVVANAGISRKDEVFMYEEDEPKQPDLSIIDVNLRGVLYTAKLALHYFVKQNGTQQSSSQEDTCLVLIGSGAAFLDCPRTPQYMGTKWAMRGIMHALRGTAYHYGSRVNVLSPWYVRTNILTKERFDQVESLGVEFAKAEDAGQALLRILSDRSVNGRMLFISARKWAPKGYLDPAIDDYEGNSLLQEIQADQLLGGSPELGLFL